MRCPHCGFSFEPDEEDNTMDAPPLNIGNDQTNGLAIPQIQDNSGGTQIGTTNISGELKGSGGASG